MLFDGSVGFEETLERENLPRPPWQHPQGRMRMHLFQNASQVLLSLFTSVVLGNLFEQRPTNPVAKYFEESRLLRIDLQQFTRERNRSLPKQNVHADKNLTYDNIQGALIPQRRLRPCLIQQQIQRVGRSTDKDLGVLQRLDRAAFAVVHRHCESTGIPYAP